MINPFLQKEIDILFQLASTFGNGVLCVFPFKNIIELIACFVECKRSRSNAGEVKAIYLTVLGRKKESSCMPFLREDSKGHFTSDVPEIGERLFENVQYCVYKNHAGKKFDSDFKICSGTIESTRLEVLSLVNDQSQETIPNSLTDARAPGGHFASSLTGSAVKTYGRPIHDAVDEVECHYLSAIRDEEFESKGQSASVKPDTLCTAVMMDGLTAHSMNPIPVAPESSADSGQSVGRDHGFRMSFPVEGNSNTPPWRPSVSLGTERSHRQKSFISYRQTEDTQSAYKYMCQICGKGSNTRFAHHRHLQCHTGQRPYVCTICGRGLSDKRSYSDHIQMHSGIRPYRCDVCHKSFKHYTTFNTHMRKIHKLRSKT
ncbi:hypothetical protein ACJMK2_025417 [Sinanodonta woodiana]|uniref:C2H2-type domain-containing protein n=1 Tax=Sinanodonta woodiana TaxID=1069815 RepID=A0ABD3XID4_SINWO